MIYQRVTLPTGVDMDVYAPPHCVDPSRRQPAIMICPGGGYAFTSAREAEPVALRFAGLGFVAFVLWYHVAPARYPEGLKDLGCAMAYVREHAADWYVDPSRVAVMGFSAGGHLACSIGTMGQDESLWQPMGLSYEQVKPNASVLCYPVISGGPCAHRGSFQNLTGSDDLSVHEQYSLDRYVTEKTPPAFIWHTWSDPSVPVENATLIACALAHHKVPAEVHIYPRGGHGASLCDDITTVSEQHDVPEATEWPTLAAKFLRSVM